MYQAYYSILLFGLIIGVIKFKMANMPLLLILFSTIVVETASYQLFKFNKSNIFLFHIFMPFENYLFCFIFYQEMKNKWIFKLILFETIIMILNSMFIQKYNVDFGTNSFVIFCLTQVIFASIYLLKILENPNEQIAFYDYRLFPISIGLIFFCSINILLLGSFNFLNSKFKSIESIFSIFRFLSNYILYISFILSIMLGKYNLHGRRI
ncbi:hypothetical protein EGI24_18100 [Lacihabitans sp. CS3-21]|nr:hypothetical protein [Lacihabitans sp. CS3-21]